MIASMRAIRWVGSGHVWRAGVLSMAVLSSAVLAILSAGGARADDLKVVATIKPVHSLVAQVMEGLGEPVLLVEGQASPHSFSLKPSDARALQGADVVVRVGASVEPFSVRIAETLPAGTTLVTLDEAPSIIRLETRRGTTFEAHEHDKDHAHEKESGPEKDHGPEKEHSHGQDHGHAPEKTNAAGHDHDIASDHDHDHEHGAFDGHIWLDPANAKAIVRHVADVLSQRRPDLKDKLAANSARAQAAIDALDAELTVALAKVEDKRFVVFHDAYQYFERHFGLQAAGAITLNPEVKPSARRLSEIRETLSKSGAVCVFAEPQFSSRIIATVIEGTSAKAGTLDPLGTTIPAGPQQYAGAMRALADAMTSCLGG